MEAKSISRFVRISSQKARLVAANIRGKNVEDARNILKFTPKKAAVVLNKILHSAIANAEQLGGIDVDTLYVKNIIINDGPSWKRIRPRAMGRAYRVLKRTSHITVIVEES
ncbi:MAG TPA: 50S ribosomal protein L22 [Desulfonatronum sp.]|nr:50S ribosomal protein L22 [Desulfonatronum sp.]